MLGRGFALSVAPASRSFWFDLLAVVESSSPLRDVWILGRVALICYHRQVYGRTVQVASPQKADEAKQVPLITHQLHAHVHCTGFCWEPSCIPVQLK